MDPIDDPLNYKWGVFYFNRNDIRTVVPKRSRVLGWTFNFAQPGSYAFVAVIIGVAVLSALL
ncbi:DUF5808 domain-containing protein [Mucilaginibacter sp. McL0603]|uniref:DUF5808 domain-containing protein n=1 Tax=Mucilaginibacter sp. McL0603 TaxID=3415670 RepID=UPI003CFA979F